TVFAEILDRLELATNGFQDFFDVFSALRCLNIKERKACGKGRGADGLVNSLSLCIKEDNPAVSVNKRNRIAQIVQYVFQHIHFTFRLGSGKSLSVGVPWGGTSKPFRSPLPLATPTKQEGLP